MLIIISHLLFLQMPGEVGAGRSRRSSANRGENTNNGERIRVGIVNRYCYTQAAHSKKMLWKGHENIISIFLLPEKPENLSTENIPPALFLLGIFLYTCRGIGW